MNSTDFFPRVLIVGQSFDTLTGGGITMSNLFKGWPKDRLAAISDMKYYPNAEICNQYYRLGDQEYRYIRPLSKILKHRRVSGEVSINLEDDCPASSTRMHKNWQESTGHVHKQNSYWRVLYSLDELIGAEHVVRRLSLSRNLSEWTSRFCPDVIYTQAGCLHEMSLARQIIKTFKLPYVIHIMDDWPSTLYADKLLAPYLRWRLAKDFRDLLNHCSVFMGISQKMCDIYQQRYKRPCIPFHNPIELDIWLAATKRDWHAGTPFRIMYRGRIGTSIQTSLIDLCNAVHAMYQAGIAVQFDITLSPDCDAQTRQQLERPGCVNVQPAIPYNDVPAALAGADLLVLSYDFDPESIKYIRYSMPTKAPEYMISGTPVLVYAAGDLAITDYAQKQKWAYVVAEQDPSQLKKALVELIRDQALREELGVHARELAIQNHDAKQVRAAFRQTFVSVMNDG